MKTDPVTGLPPPARDAIDAAATVAHPPGCHPDWIVPDWPAPARVRAVCTTRAGGSSAPPYDSLNLGDHVGDDPQAVRANRARLQAAIGAVPHFLRQVHGVQVLVLDGLGDPGKGAAGGTERSGAASGDIYSDNDCEEHANTNANRDGDGDGDHVLLPEADAATTRQPGVACTVMVADCLPVLLTDAQGTQVAAAHAGWRGLAGGILDQVLACFRPPAQVGPGQTAIDLIAWLGPCIGPEAFEVGHDVHAAFCAGNAAAQRCFVPTGTPGRWWADLAGLARLRLQSLGVRADRIHGNDGSRAWSTAAQPSRFFSYRRDQRPLGGSGRFAACVWIDDRPGGDRGRPGSGGR